MNTDDWRMEFVEEKEDELAHYGKKGMKWGQRRAAKKEATAESDRQIIGARIRNDKRAESLQKKAFETYTATSEKGRKIAEENYSKAEAKFLSHPDTKTAATLTSGEKRVQRFNTGATLVGIGLLLGSAALGAAKS